MRTCWFVVWLHVVVGLGCQPARDVDPDGPNRYTLTTTRSGSGSGSVRSSPAGIACGVACSSDFDSGAVVTLIATPDAGAVFTGWSGAGCFGTAACTVSVSAAITVDARFALVAHPLTVTKTGTGGGAVSSSPAGIACGATCTAVFDHGTTVVLTAAPSVGSSFTGWSGGGCSGAGTCTATVIGATEITAAFTLDQHTLTVAKAGSGVGTVTSSPAGIDCGATCATSFDHGQTVVLSAVPASSSTFAGWSGGGCAGTETCTTTVTAAVTVTASWTLCPSASLSAGGGGAWSFRMPIPIAGSSAGAQSDYVVPVTLDTAALVSAGKLQTSGADLRFANAAGTELAWWLERGMNTASTRMWVAVDQIPVLGTEIYVYYSNPSATMSGAFANSGRSTFAFFDDFEGGALDPALWVDGNDPQYQPAVVQGGALHLHTTGTYPAAENADVQTVPALSGSYAAEFAMTMSNVPDNPSWKSIAWMAAIGSATADHGQLSGNDTAGTSGWWSNGVQDCAPVNGTYTGKIEADATAGSFTLSLGSTVCRTTSGISIPSPYVFYFKAQGDGSLTVDLWDFRVRPIVYPEPVANGAGPEQAACMRGITRSGEARTQQMLDIRAAVGPK